MPPCLLQRNQSRTQSPLAFWSADGRQQRLWGTGILLPQDFCGKTMEVVAGQPIKKFFFFFEFPRVSTGAHPLTKKPEDSGYEIAAKFDGQKQSDTSVSDFKLFN